MSTLGQTDTGLIYCQLCNQSFTRKHGLAKHLSLNRCPVIKTSQKSYIQAHPPKVVPPKNIPTSVPVLNNLEKTVADLMNQVAELRNLTGNEVRDIRSNMNQLKEQKPNQLQVVCLGDNDNYLEILKKQWNFQQALDFVKNCALSRLAGDCRLLEKIYLSGDQPSIVYANRSRTRFAYFDEEQNQMVEGTGKSLARKLAANLQGSYMDSVKCFTDVENEHHAKLQKKPLDAFDLEIWHRHIYELSDETYQKKILSSLNIPFEPDLKKTLPFYPN